MVKERERCTTDLKCIYGEGGYQSTKYVKPTWAIAKSFQL